jgi:hypothetical protein
MNTTYVADDDDEMRPEDEIKKQHLVLRRPTVMVTCHGFSIFSTIATSHRHFICKKSNNLKMAL